MRPSLHLTATTGWVNDPHGMTVHDGRYHLFYQYVPDRTTWAPACEWGHASSPDLLTWTQHGVALTPGDGDDGIWTGALVRDGERTRILYTSVSHPDLALGRIRLASPDDDSWEHWTKGEVVAAPPEDLGLVAYRDPFVLRDGSCWRMLVGGASADGDALALSYASEDLDTWTFEGAAVRRSTRETQPVWTGSLWECPQLFEVDGHWVLLTSVWDRDVLHHVGYGIGDGDSYRDGRFTPADWGQLTYGGSYYAASYFRDREGRPGVMFWLRGVTDAEGTWAGCLSVPFLLRVEDGRLAAAPHPEVAGARRSGLAAGEPADAFDLSWSPPPDGGHLTLADGSGAESARVVADGESVRLERRDRETWSMPWRGDRLRVVVDGPVIEISSSAGLLGGPVEPVRTWAGTGAVEAWVLATGPDGG